VSRWSLASYANLPPAEMPLPQALLDIHQTSEPLEPGQDQSAIRLDVPDRWRERDGGGVRYNRG